MKIQKFIDKFAKLHLKYQKQQSKIIKNLSNNDLKLLIDKLKKQALGSEVQSCFGFRVTCWDDFANNLEKELYYRNIFEKAKKLNGSYYCLTCDGECLGEETHDIKIHTKTKEEMLIHEMSREDLIKELINLKKKNK